MKTPGDLLSDPTWALAFRSLEPAPDTPRRLLLLLHGFGSDELQLAAAGAAVDADTLVILPRAPRTVSGGRHGWFRLEFEDDDQRIVVEEAQESRDKLGELVDQLQQRKAIAPSATVLAGFSQGGVMAADLALTSPRRLAGFAMLGGRILAESEALVTDPAGLAALRALLLHGRDDRMLAPRWAARADRLLDRLGVPHELRLFEAGHAPTPVMQAELLRWFDDPQQPWNADP